MPTQVTFAFVVAEGNSFLAEWINLRNTVLPPGPITPRSLLGLSLRSLTHQSLPFAIWTKQYAIFLFILIVSFPVTPWIMTDLLFHVWFGGYVLLGIWHVVAPLSLTYSCSIVL